MWPSHAQASLLSTPYRASLDDLAFLARIANRKATINTLPRWMMYELQMGAITNDELGVAAERIEGFVSPSAAMKELVADGSSLPKKLKTSLADFVASLNEKDAVGNNKKAKAKLECIGRAKAAAFICELLKRPYRIMGNETHMYVTDGEDGTVYDFKFNLTHRDDLQKKRRMVPSYYFQAVELDDDGMLATLILDNKAFDPQQKLVRLRMVYPSDVRSAPVWVRVFLYEHESPLEIYSDADALSHPFVCLSFAELLGSVALLQRSLVSLDCRRFEFDDDFFYKNEDGVSFMSVMERMWRDRKLPEQSLIDVTEVAKERARACAPDPIPKRFADKVQVFMEKEIGLRKRRRGT